ncbi:hypothetical protein ABZU32_21255 [Sphaerisporangium sp. NPDC005288]|uniref:hypothetical protein n=1 Tax=Sphaerisporangium sp. NPDC005288 TaxID=3155114 RepID=UPI0033A7260B
MAHHAELFLGYDIDDDRQDPLYREAVVLAVIELESGIRLDRARFDREQPTMLVTWNASGGLDFPEFDD